MHVSLVLSVFPEAFDWIFIKIFIFLFVLLLSELVGVVYPESKLSANGLYIEFRQSFAKETFSYDEHLKS